MLTCRWPALLLGLALLSGGTAFGGGADDPKANQSVQALAKQAKPSIAVVTVTGRDGKERGLGTGFVVRADGLIATNLHVIGEARPITVQLAGKQYSVTAVHASDRPLDLAILQIDARGLPALELADSDKAEDGQAVVVLGHPEGLKHSVVGGVVSGRQKIDGQNMLQLAIPIEAGNSGGPVLDGQGRVLGVVTLRSQVTANLGFAVPVNALKGLLARPNPITIERWVTIGTLNPEEWTTVFAGRWRQRNGTILVDGPGTGFAGRALCLSKRESPAVPFEVAALVRLEDEAGAAGLAFYADGKDRHYGFYPSNGNLRLTRFEGPDVYSWKVLHNAPSPHYKPGEWNFLKVRVEKDRILCYVNDQLVVESKDQGLTSGAVGLCKFRDSRAEFKHFAVGKEVPALMPSAEVVARVVKAASGINLTGAPRREVVEALLPDATAAMGILRAKAKKLEQEAAQLRRLAEAVHQERVLAELAKVVAGPDEKIDLIDACLLVARLDNEELDVAAYRKQVERIAQELLAKLPREASARDKLTALTRDLFQERGFHGSRSDFYHRANSHLNEVLDDREGLPITLGILYLELARRLGLQVDGVGLPVRFMVLYRPGKGPGVWIDVFDGGQELTGKQVMQKVRDLTGEEPKKGDFVPLTKRAILVRLLNNLTVVAQKEGDARGFLRYYDALVLLQPEDVEVRLTRAAARYRTGDQAGTLADIDWLMESGLPGVNRERLLELRGILNKGN
jgi:regulator of sirC expression with transglutaminase-like and TPR domain